MDITFLFSFGFLTTILQVHMLSFGLSQVLVALCFVFQGATYLVVSLTAETVFKKVDERGVMLIGCFSMTVGYLFMGPCSYIFPNDVAYAIIGLPFIGIGQSLCYSN